MATFEARIEDYVGTVDDKTAFDYWCAEEAWFAIRHANEALLRNHATRTLVSDSAGFATKDKRVLTVSRRRTATDLRRCREVDEDMAGSYTTTGSLLLATAMTPVFYVETTATDTRLFIKPDPAVGAEGVIVSVARPTIDADVDQTATGVPTAAEELVVLGVARRVLQRRLDDHDADEDPEEVKMATVEMERLAELYQRLAAKLFEEAQ